MTTVALVPVESYDQPLVDEAVARGISLLGGPEQFLKQDEKIVVKPNLLGAAPAQKAVTTHPAVFAAVVKALQGAGFNRLTWGDSPGNPSTTPEKAARACGIWQEAERLGVPMGDFQHGTREGGTGLVLCNGILEADALVNVCKMKTHALERITGAVKNLYGCVFSANKALGHASHPSSEAFAELMCDIHRTVKPRLHIMDGIVAMEGNGPNAGTPVSMNVLLFSGDPVALDTVFSLLVNLKPELVPTCVAAQKAGLGTMKTEEIRVVTPEGTLTPEEAAARWGKPDFQVNRGQMKSSLLGKFLPCLPFLQEKPVVDRSRCIACGICQEACPVAEKAVHSGHGQKARYDYKKCIRCYCCQEMCPAHAITRKNGWKKQG